MERKMSRHWPGFRAFCILILLSLENGTLGAINPDNLMTIVNYIRNYGINSEYAVAVRLDEMICQDPTAENLNAVLPLSVMSAMQHAIEMQNGMYEGQNVVAAKPKVVTTESVNYTEHAEWRLLSGGRNSSISNMINNRENTCLIFFTKESPCTSICLNGKSKWNISYLVKDLFYRFDQDSRAFVFEDIHEGDTGNREWAWSTISHAPLFRCYAMDNGVNECIQCFDNNFVVDGRCLVA